MNAIARSFIEALSSKEGQAVNVNDKYNGLHARILSDIDPTQVVGETVLHGFMADAYKDGKIVLVAIPMVEGDQAHNMDQFIDRCEKFAAAHKLILVGYDPGKATATKKNGTAYMSIGFVVFWRTNKLADLEAWFTNHAGFDGATVLPYLAANPEKGWKYLNARIENGTDGEIYLWNMKRDFVSLTAALRKITGDNTVIVEDYLYDGFAVMSAKNTWAINNGLVAGDIFQARGHATKTWDGEMIGINCAKGVVYIASEEHFEKWVKFHNLKGDLTQTVVSTSNFLKCTVDGEGYYIPNFAIHARWNGTGGRDRGVLGVQALYRNTNTDNKSLVYMQVEKQIKELTAAIRSALIDYDTRPLGTYLGSIELDDLDGSEFLDAASLIKLGRDWREVSRMKSADSLLGKLVSNAGKAAIDGWRDYVMSPLFYMVITGKSLEQGSIALSPEASHCKSHFGSIVNVFRNPIISRTGALVPFKIVKDPEWIYHGSAMQHYLDAKGRLFAGATMDEDFDGDKIFISSQKWIKVDFVSYWSNAVTFVTKINDWKASGKDVRALVHDTIPMPHFNSLRGRTLWLAHCAARGIPAADSYVGRLFMDGSHDDWHDKCAYQSIVELIKHTTDGAIIDAEKFGGDTEPTVSGMVYAAIKSGMPFSQMLTAIAYAKENKQFGGMTMGKVSRRVQKLWIAEMYKLHNDINHLPKWDGVMFPEFVENNRPSALMSFLSGITNLRPCFNRHDWTLPASVTFYQELHMEIAKRAGKTKIEMGKMKQMSEVKATAVARIEGIIRWHKMICTIRDNPEKITGQYKGNFGAIPISTHFMVLGKEMGVDFVASRALTAGKLLDYSKELAQWLSMDHEDFVYLIVEALWWSFANSSNHESNLWFIGGKTIAMMLEKSGTPNFCLNDQQSGAVTDEEYIRQAF